MWSAPHQPFVLPVRVRSFEQLYNINVKLDDTSKAITETPAQKIHHDVIKRHDDLAKKLKESLKGHNIKFIEIPNAGVGIYKGQLFHIIKEVKGDNDYETENQLMEPLLTLILGEGSIKQAANNNRDYFCASKDNWEKALAITIHISAPSN
jgi:hypothetical protein